MKTKVIQITQEQFAKIKKIVDDKSRMHEQIKAGNFSGLKS